MTTHYAYNTQEKINPTGERAARETQARSTIYIINVSKDFVHAPKSVDGIRRGRGSFATQKLRVYVQYGPAEMRVGWRFAVRSSLNHRILCSSMGAEVVGVIDTDGTVSGEVPDRMLPWWVAK